MKVNIGKYQYFWGVYQIAEAILFWIPKYTNTDDYNRNPAYEKYVEGFGDILAKTPLNDLCQWIESKRKRKVEIKIHNYDAWNAFHTMALIILPVLQELKKQKQGAGMIDDEDVPWYLRSTMCKENEFDSDGNVFARYEWVLDEMIWTFQQIVDDNWPDRYYHGENDIFFESVDGDNSKFKELKHGPNHTFWIDTEGFKNHQKCIEIILFG